MLLWWWWLLVLVVVIVPQPKTTSELHTWTQSTFSLVLNNIITIVVIIIIIGQCYLWKVISHYQERRLAIDSVWHVTDNGNMSSLLKHQSKGFGRSRRDKKRRRKRSQSFLNNTLDMMMMEKKKRRQVGSHRQELQGRERVREDRVIE